jgi:hypothetical protein
MEWEHCERLIDLPTIEYTAGWGPLADQEAIKRFNEWVAWQLQILNKYEGWVAEEATDFDTMWRYQRVVSRLRMLDMTTGVYDLQAAKVRVKRPKTHGSSVS